MSGNSSEDIPAAFDYVSVLGVRLLQPLIDLVEKLESLPRVEQNEVQSSPRENGYSCAVIVLSALMLESALNRTRCLRKDASEPTHVADYFKTILISSDQDPGAEVDEVFETISSDQDLAVDVNEVFAIRDAIVHNHIWKAKIDPVAMKFTSPPELLPCYGRKRFLDVMDPKTRLSRKLTLNLFPSRICRGDAYIVVKTMGRALTALDEMDPNYFPIRFENVLFRGEFVRLPEVLNALST